MVTKYQGEGLGGARSWLPTESIFSPATTFEKKERASHHSPLLPFLQHRVVQSSILLLSPIFFPSYSPTHLEVSSSLLSTHSTTTALGSRLSPASRACFFLS
eukprot:scaffold90816_cov30-Tisochrysis_lutea.AAC.1